MNRSCAVAALALAAATAFSAPASADWYYRRGWSPGAAAAVGVLGGVAVGAAIAANARPAPAPVYVAPPPPVYVAPAPGISVNIPLRFD